MPKRPRKEARSQKGLLGNSRQKMFFVVVSMVAIQTGRYMFKIENLNTFVLQSDARRTNISENETSQYDHYETPAQSLQQTIPPVSAPLAATDTPVIKEPNTKTWALVSPPGLMGGYRNQVFRLFGFILAAREQNITQLLLPSILWSTRVNNTYATRPVPMEDVFDIDHWNSLAETKKELPKLIDAVDMDGELDCWTSPDSSEGNQSREQDFLNDNQAFTHKLRTQSSDGPLMERLLSKPRFLTPIANISLAYTTGHSDINPRRFDVSPQVQHCKNPIAFGGGGGLRGHMWVNFMNYNRRRPRDRNTGHVQPSSLEQNFLQALRPHPKWRQLAQQCVTEGIHSNTDRNDENYLQSRAMSNVIALHPRVELEMMGHSCGAFMNKNLTKIFDDITDLLQNNTHLAKNISGVFVALHRAGAASKEGRSYHRFRAFVDENIETMDRVIGDAYKPGTGLMVVGDGASDVRRLPVFECGEQLIERYHESQSSTGQQAVDYGSLLPSIINFEVAVESAVFVGMRSSSWSNSVWTARYYLGKGDANFEYTRERGVRPMENGGLPPPHQNCDAIKDPG